MVLPKRDFAIASPRSLCHGAALVWLGGVWDEGAGESTTDF